VNQNTLPISTLLEQFPFQEFGMSRLLTLFALLLVASPSFAAEPVKELEGFDAAVEKAMKAHGVPGLGLAIVQDGKVVLMKGYGVRTFGKPEPVTEKSLFAIGSVSKSFTALALAMLVDEGKLSWDTPIIAKLPTFRMNDPYLTQETTVRDALSHRVGLSRNELVWYGSSYDRKDVMQKLRLIKPESPIRTKFLYNNMMYMTAGQILPEVTKKTWDEYLQEKVFTPLKMTSANTSITKFSASDELASPHESALGKPSVVPWRNIDNIGGAGSINASTADMVEYVKFQLTKGKLGDKRLLKKAVFEEMHTPQMLMGKPGFSFNPGSISHDYGLGWMLSDFKGKPVVEHGGNIDGMTAQVGMLPESKLGVVLLANRGQSLLPQCLMYDIFDRFTGDTTADRANQSAFLGALTQFAISVAGEVDEKKKIKDTKPSLELKKYAGTYQDEIHPPLKVQFKDDKLAILYFGTQYNLEHWHYDTFVGTDKKIPTAKALFTFALDQDGAIVEVRIKQPGKDIQLKKLAK
jgi:CubicO group peptidase (beta-lactamase class C family)